MNWKLFHNEQGEPAVKVSLDNTQMSPKISILALIASDPESGIVQIEPGIYVTSTMPDDVRDHLLAVHREIMRRYSVPLDEADGYPGH